MAGIQRLLPTIDGVRDGDEDEAHGRDDESIADRGVRRRRRERRSVHKRGWICGRFEDNAVFAVAHGTLATAKVNGLRLSLGSDALVFVVTCLIVQPATGFDYLWSACIITPRCVTMGTFALLGSFAIISLIIAPARFFLGVSFTVSICIFEAVIVIPQTF